MSLIFLTAARQPGYMSSSYATQYSQFNSYDVDTPVSSDPDPSLSVTTSDVPQAPPPTTDSTDATDSIAATTPMISPNTKTASDTAASSARVRYIVIGVLTFVAIIILLSVLVRRTCQKDRRRRLTIRLVRKRSDSSMQIQRGTASSSSFCIGDKSPEDRLKLNAYATRNERGVSCAPSAGLAGIGTTKSTHDFRYNTQPQQPQPSFQNTDENNPKPNFDTPYGTSTRVLKQWQGMTAPLTFNHLTPDFNAEKNKVKKLDSRQGKENLCGSDARSDTKRNSTAFMKYPAGPLVTVHNGPKERIPCVNPVTMPPRVFTSSEKEWMRGIAF